MKSGDTARVLVESLTLEGEGVARLDGRELRCRGVFPREEAVVRVEALSRQHPRAHARLLAVAQPHPGRRHVPCANHEAREGRCAGCALMALDEEAQRDAKRLMLRERFGLEVARIEPAPQPFGYRFSSKRVVLATRGLATLGSFAHGSHAPAAMAGCMVDHPLLAEAFDRVERELRRLAIEPYDEHHVRGDLRYVWGKTNGAEVILTLISARAISRVGELVAPLAAHVAGLLHSVQPSRGNALRGGPAALLHGQRELTLELLGQRVELGALGFVQPNPEQAAGVYQALAELDTFQGGRALAFDLYAGAGVTAGVLAAEFAQVLACEAHPESAALLGVAPEPVETFLAHELARVPRRMPDLVLANPPRKGLGAEVCRQLAALGAPALRIMSCGPEALARDLLALAPRYQLVSLEAFDTLPQTPHVELVAKLTAR